MRRGATVFHLLSLLGLACSIAAATEADRTRWRTMVSALEELEKAETDLVEAKDMDARVAGWARMSPVWDRAEPPPDPEGLRRLIDGGDDPRSRALACLWLAVLQEPGDLERVAALVESRAAAGTLPEIVKTSGEGDRSDVAWRPLTLGLAARLALRHLSGKELGDRRAYRGWKLSTPAPDKSLIWWKARYDSSSAARREEVLKELRNRNPLLFARLVMQVVPPRGERLTAAQLRLNADTAGILEATLGLEGLKAVLRDGIDWEELKNSELVVKTKQWVLLQWTRILGTREARSLSELWYDRGHVEPRFIHPELALALGEADPAQRATVLQKMLLEVPRPDVSDALRSLAEVIPLPQAWALNYWFYGQDGPETDANRIGILEGLQRAGADGRLVLRALIKLYSVQTDSPVFVAALVKTVRAFGCRDRFPLLSQIGPVPDPARGARDEEYKQAVALTRKAAAARKDCIRRVRKFLRPDMPP